MEYPESRLRDYSTDASIGRGALDVPFAALTILLLTIGVIMVLSASYVRAYYTENGNATYYFTRQLIFAVSGVVIVLAMKLVGSLLISALIIYLCGFVGFMKYVMDSRLKKAEEKAMENSNTEASDKQVPDAETNEKGGNK